MVYGVKGRGRCGNCTVLASLTCTASLKLSVPNQSAWRHIPEDLHLHPHRCRASHLAERVCCLHLVPKSVSRDAFCVCFRRSLPSAKRTHYVKAASVGPSIGRPFCGLLSASNRGLLSASNRGLLSVTNRGQLSATKLWPTVSH
jgi:hypothetical protein